MYKLPLTLAFAALVGLSAASAGEKVEEELVKLRKEIAALRAEVAKLAGQKEEHKLLLKGLLDIAAKLRAGEKLAEGSAELAVLEKCLRKGGDLGARVMGLVSKLPPGQRCAVFGAMVTDVTVYNGTRQAALRELVAEGSDAARKAVRAAIGTERLLPAGRGLANHSYYDFKPRLAVAAGDLKDKVAVELSVECLEELAEQAARSLERKKNGGKQQAYAYGASLYGTTGTLVKRLKHWSGQEGLAQFLGKANARGRSYFRIDSQEKIEALKAELAKVKAWWGENEAKFEFPEEIEPAEAAPQKLMNKKPIEQF